MDIKKIKKKSRNGVMILPTLMDIINEKDKKLKEQKELQKEQNKPKMKQKQEIPFPKKEESQFPNTQIIESNTPSDNVYSTYYTVPVVKSIYSALREFVDSNSKDYPLSNTKIFIGWDNSKVLTIKLVPPKKESETIMDTLKLKEEPYTVNKCTEIKAYIVTDNESGIATMMCNPEDLSYLKQIYNYITTLLKETSGYEEPKNGDLLEINLENFFIIEGYLERNRN